MNCEMCGTETSLINAMVEDVELKVCKTCSSFGKVLKRPPKSLFRKNRPIIKKQQKELLELIEKDYFKIIKEKREKMGLKQKEFAKFLAERESLIHKMESGSYKPSIELARKLEKQLGITIVEQKELEPQQIQTKKQTYTIGDMIKIKK